MLKDCCALPPKIKRNIPYFMGIQSFHHGGRAVLVEGDTKVADGSHCADIRSKDDVVDRMVGLGWSGRILLWFTGRAFSGQIRIAGEHAALQYRLGGDELKFR